VQLAWAHYNDAVNGYTSDPARSLEQFHAAADKMVALDPMNPDALVVAGVSYFKRGERARGKAAWERALALAPTILTSSETWALICPSRWARSGRRRAWS
jgi:hypothetical protein